MSLNELDSERMAALGMYYRREPIVSRLFFPVGPDTEDGRYPVTCALYAGLNGGRAHYCVWRAHLIVARGQPTQIDTRDGVVLESIASEQAVPDTVAWILAYAVPDAPAFEWPVFVDEQYWASWVRGIAGMV